MASFSKITIVGYLGKDPELKYTPQGASVTTFSVATTEKRKNIAGEAEEHTTWFRVTVWGKQAEACAQYLTKGSQVYVEGRLRMESYTDREGAARHSLEVNASDVQFLGRAGERTDAAPAQKPVNSLPEARERYVGMTSGNDHDIPF